MKYVSILLLLLSCAILSAEPPYYPTTPMVENFGASWCGACEYAQQGLAIMEDNLLPNEAIISRLLTESGSYSNDEVDSRFDYYAVTGLPAVIFNGKVRVDGADDAVASGEPFIDAISNFRYLASPVKMEVTNFDAASGAITVNTTMYNDTYTTDDGTLYFYLLEDELLPDLTRLVRSVKSLPISLSGEGESISLSTTFSLDPSWNTDHLWAFAFIQMPGNAIIQAASTIEMPQFYVRAAVPFDNAIQGTGDGVYQSPLFWVYNMGEADEITISIETISAPEGWTLNYCDTAGNCYPGSMQIPFNFAAQAAKSFDLNIWAEGEGTARLNFVLESDNGGIYKIPFSYSLGETSNSDLFQVPAQVSLGKSYPNPFLHSVNFEIDSQKTGMTAAIEIFNIKGQKLKELPLTNLKQGQNTISWNAEDLPAGIYFYHLKNTKQSGKIVKLN